MTLHTFQSEVLWVEAIISHITPLLSQTNSPSLLLSGGTTPKPVYKALGRQKLPWEHIHLYQTDERLVPRHHAMSNQSMIESMLGEEIIKKAIPHFLPSTHDQEELDQVLPYLPKEPFTIGILGMGIDGHIASIFPDDPHIHTSEPAYFVERPPHEYHRVTLSLKRILESTELLLLLRDEEKIKLLHNPISPLAEVLNHPGLTIYALLTNQQ